MANQYYFARDVAQFGPFSATQMRGLAATGQIHLTDSVWQEGPGQQKIQAAKVKNLFADLPSQPHVGGAALPTTHLDQAAPQAAQRASRVSEGSKTDEPAGEDANPVAPPAETAPLVASEEPAPQATPRAPQPKPREKRVISIKGGVLFGQDGVQVQFRKKCGTCGQEDTTRSRAVIRVGSFRVPFFCPKCRRLRSVDMMGAG